MPKKKKLEEEKNVVMATCVVAMCPIVKVSEMAAFAEEMGLNGKLLDEVVAWMAERGVLMCRDGFWYGPIFIKPLGELDNERAGAPN